ncbi:MAG TPA: deoxyribonuclease IV [Mycobacteriales bacterium]|nr:deoxyribonuclease IV [Mycobacteriales bacterium]
MLIGAHVDPQDPLGEAAARQADLVQIFLADPQGWRKPDPRADADELRASGVTIYVHAPYIVNVATTNNKIRIPSRKILDQHCAAAASIGAAGVIVHGGHVGDESEVDTGIDNWRKTCERLESDVPVLIENTAGGTCAMARRFDMLGRLWDALGEYDVGFCLDTCHAHAGGEDLVGIVERVRGITGRIDLVHANDSKDPADSGRDRHENFGSGRIDPDLLVEVVRTAGAPVVCETPGGVEGQSADIAFLRDRV